MHKKRFALQSVFAVALAALMVWAVRPVYPSSTDLLQFLPDGMGVVIVDFDQVTASSLWSSTTNQKGVRNTLEKVQRGIAEVVNPSDIRSLVVAIDSFDLRNVAAVANGRFNQSEILTRLKADPKIKLTAETYQGVDLYRVGPAESSSSKREAAFAFYDASTVVGGTLTGVKASIDTKLGGKNSIAQNAKLAGALAETQPAAIRFALTATSDMKRELQSSDLPIPDFSSIDLIFGAVDLTSGLDFNATLRSDSAEHAKSIADRLNGLLSMAKGFLGATGNPNHSQFVDLLKTVNVTCLDADVKINGNMPVDLLDSLLNGGRKN